METFSALLAICAGNSPVTGEFPAQRPVTRSFDVFFDPHPNKQLSKQWRGWWFETLSWSLWRHRNGRNWCWSRHQASLDAQILAKPAQGLGRGLRDQDLGAFVVTIHDGACEQKVTIPRPHDREIIRTLRKSPSALGRQTLPVFIAWHLLISTHGFNIPPLKGEYCRSKIRLTSPKYLAGSRSLWMDK